MPDEAKRPLKVFLCHAHDDKAKARELYRFLKKRGIQPWLDAEDLLPGQTWQVEIPKALESSDAIIILLSKTSVDKEGYVQKEIKFALDKALEMPEGRIFLIPARLEECDVPRSISGYHWVDLFEQGGYDKLMKSLKLRVVQLERASFRTLKVDEPKPDLPQKPETEPLKSISAHVNGNIQRNIITGDENHIFNRPEENNIVEKRKPRIFYDLAQHYESDIPDANAEVVAKDLLELLTRIVRVVDVDDKNDIEHTTQFSVDGTEYFDPKSGHTIQHAFLVRGSKAELYGKGINRIATSLKDVPEMLIVTVTQGIRRVRLNFDSDKLPKDIFDQFVQMLLHELGFAISLSKPEESSKPSEADDLNLPKPLRKLKPGYIIAIIGATATILAALIGVLPQYLTPVSVPTTILATATSTIQAPTDSHIALPSSTLSTAIKDLTPSKTPSPILPPAKQTTSTQNPKIDLTNRSKSLFFVTANKSLNILNISSGIVEELLPIEFRDYTENYVAYSTLFWLNEFDLAIWSSEQLQLVDLESNNIIKSPFNDFGFSSSDISTDGKVLVDFSINEATLYVSDIDNGGGVSEPKSIGLNLDNYYLPFCIRWKPDDSTVAFIVSSRTGNMINGSNLAILRYGFGEKPVIVQSHVDGCISWSPDGKYIVYGNGKPRKAGFSYYSYTQGIYYVDIKSGLVTKLSNARGYYPVWSPDGKTIAFLTEQGISLVDVQTKNEKQIYSGDVIAILWGK